MNIRENYETPCKSKNIQETLWECMTIYENHRQSVKITEIQWKSLENYETPGNTRNQRKPTKTK